MMAFQASIMVDGGTFINQFGQKVFERGASPGYNLFWIFVNQSTFIRDLNLVAALFFGPVQRVIRTFGETVSVFILP